MLQEKLVEILAQLLSAIVPLLSHENICSTGGKVHFLSNMESV